MTKLCLGTYFASIKYCKNNRFVQSKDVNKLFYDIAKYELDESSIGHMVRGNYNPSSAFIDEIYALSEEEMPGFVSRFDNIANKIDPNKRTLLEKMLVAIVQEDDSIKGDTVVDIVNGTTKNELQENKYPLNSFLAGLFIYAVRYTKNQKMQSAVKEIDHAFVFRIDPPANLVNDDSKVEDESMPVQDDSLNEELSDVEMLDFLINKDIVNIDYEAVVLSAKEFLLKYEDVLGLIPLCHMAYIYKPHHKHCRQMYTEYCLLSDEDRKYILEYCEYSSLINFNKEIIGASLKAFISDVERYDLSEKRFLYIFNQYYPRAIEYYANRRIDMYELESFIRLYTQSNSKIFELSEYSTLDQYIYDYLWFRNNEPSKELTRPLDYLWINGELASCREYDLTFWICRFIIDACSNINVVNIDTDIPLIFIEDNLLETQEDMYYCSLISLYDNFLKRTKES